MDGSLNIEKQSKTSEGRIALIKNFTQYSSNQYLRARDNECWTMFNNTGDEKEFQFLTQVGEFALPAKIRRIPIQRSKANILLSQQSLRKTKYGIRMVDSEGVKGKITRLYREMTAMYAALLTKKQHSIQYQLAQIDQYVGQMQGMLEKQPETAEEAQDQAKIREELPQILYQTGIVKENMSLAVKMTKEEKEKFLNKLDDDYEDLYEVYSKKLLVKVREEMESNKVSLKNFRNKIVVGREYTYVNYNAKLGELEYKSINPYLISYPNIQDIEWVQDCPWVVLEAFMTKEQIRKNWNLNQSQLKTLEGMTYSQTASQGAFVTGPGQVVVLDNQNSDGAENKFVLTGEGISVKLVWWRADFKIQAIQSPNKYSESGYFTAFVDDDKDLIDISEYKFNKKTDEYTHKKTGQVLSKAEVNMYNSRKGQEKQIRYYDKRFFGVNIANTIILEGEDPVQPHPQDNYGYTPLPIVGPTFNGLGEYPYSIIWATTELQKQYWVVSYHRELTFALAGASGVVFDLSQKPDGMTKEEWFYHMKLGRYLIQTISKTGARKNTGYNQFTNVDQTLTNSIQYFESILQGIEQQIGTLMGIPRQRQGEIVATDQVGTFDQANRQAMLVTEIMFSEHDEVESKSLDMLLNLAVQYKFKPDEVIDVGEDQAKLIKIPYDLGDRKFRLKLINSAKQDIDLEEMKRMTAQMSANGNLPYEFLFKIFSVDSLKEMEGLVELQIQRQQELASLQAQGSVEAEAKAEQALIKMKQDFDGYIAGMESKLKEAQMKIDASLKSRELDIKEKQVDGKITDDSIKTEAQINKDVADVQLGHRKQSEDERHNRVSEVLEQTELELEALLKSTGVSRGLEAG